MKSTKKKLVAGAIAFSIPLSAASFVPQASAQENTPDSTHTTTDEYMNVGGVEIPDEAIDQGMKIGSDLANKAVADLGSKDLGKLGIKDKIDSILGKDGGSSSSDGKDGKDGGSSDGKESGAASDSNSASTSKDGKSGEAKRGTVKVHASGDKEDVKFTLLNDGEEVDSGTTDENGDLELSYDPENVDTQKLTIATEDSEVELSDAKCHAEVTEVSDSSDKDVSESSGNIAKDVNDKLKGKKKPSLGDIDSVLSGAIKKDSAENGKLPDDMDKDTDNPQASADGDTDKDTDDKDSDKESDKDEAETNSIDTSNSAEGYALPQTNKAIEDAGLSEAEVYDIGDALAKVANSSVTTGIVDAIASAAQSPAVQGAADSVVPGAGKAVGAAGKIIKGIGQNIGPVADRLNDASKKIKGDIKEKTGGIKDDIDAAKGGESADANGASNGESTSTSKDLDVTVDSDEFSFEVENGSDVDCDVDVDGSEDESTTSTTSSKTSTTQSPEVSTQGAGSGAAEVSPAADGHKVDTGFSTLVGKISSIF